MNYVAALFVMAGLVPAIHSVTRRLVCGAPKRACMNGAGDMNRHCEERSDEAIQRPRLEPFGFDLRRGWIASLRSQ